MQANREGRFRARVMDVGVNETGPNKLCTVVLRFALVEEYDKGEWNNIESEELDAVAYCYVEKRDGSLNDFQVAALKEAFGWPGMDPFWFEETKEFPPVQVTLESEEYNGKDRIKVRFINSYDSEPGGITHADGDTRRALMARLGHKLRAHSGGKPAPAPKPTGAPKPPPKPAAAPQAPGAPASSAKSASTMDAVWALFAKWAETKGASQDELNKTWFDAIKAVCGHEDAEKVTPEQWAQVADKLPVPF
jgi:hypothetical protein